MKIPQLVFRILGKFCVKLYGSVFNTIAYRGKTSHKHFILHILVLFPEHVFSDYVFMYLGHHYVPRPGHVAEKVFE